MDVTTAFIDSRSPEGIRIRAIGDDPAKASLIYPDQPSFLADGRLVYNASTGPMTCDLESMVTRPLLEEPASELHLSPGGHFAIWNATTKEAPERLVLRRLDVATGRIETVFEADGNLPGTSLPADRFKVRTLSGDGQRVASGFWVGDGTQADAPFAIVSLALQSGQACLVAEDRDFLNPHLQYCHCQDAGAARDLLIQMNHGARTDASGKTICMLGPPSDLGVDVHVVRDDGSNWRDLPWGRDGVESCIGHQIWRGNTRAAVTVTLQNQDRSYGWADGTRQEVVSGQPVPADREAPHQGRLGRDAYRTLLSEGFAQPRFCHLACDDSGLRFVLDTFPIFDGTRTGMHLYLGSASDAQQPLAFQYVLNTGIVFNAHDGYHAHPILSPDGSAMLFNSDLTGVRRPYVVTGFSWPSA